MSLADPQPIADTPPPPSTRLTGIDRRRIGVALLEGRARAVSLPDLAERYGITLAVARKLMQAELDRRAEPNVAYLRAQNMARVEWLMARLVPLIDPEDGSGPDLYAVREYRELMAFANKMMGANAPEKTAVDVNVTKVSEVHVTLENRLDAMGRRVAPRLASLPDPAGAELPPYAEGELVEDGDLLAEVTAVLDDAD